MISLNKHRNGFTIIELLIVIVVIGILVSLVITTHSGIEAKTRNNKRSDAVLYIHGQLEAFVSQKSYYPRLKDINNSKWVSDNMKRFDTNYLIDPSNPDRSKKLAASPVAKSYAYSVKNSSGQSCELDITTCVQYSLTATYEGTVNGKTTIVSNNLD